MKITPSHFLISWLHMLKLVSLLTYIGGKPSLVYKLILIGFHRFSIKYVSYMAFHSQICNIKRFLQQNRFPSQLIDRINKRFLNKQCVVDVKPSSVPILPIFLFLPYLGVYCIHLKKRLTNFLGKIYPHPDLKIVFRANKPIGGLFPFTDRVTSHVCSSFVYKFTFSSCQATYYGKTSRHFIVCCREHLGLNKKGGSVKDTSSASRDHIKDTGHSASLDNFCIIDRTNNELDLLLHGSLLILRDRPTFNFQSSSIPLCLY